MINTAINYEKRNMSLPPEAMAERRRSGRTQVKSGVVALLHPDGPVEIGNIIDINGSGLSFIADAGARRRLHARNQLKMDILLINENIFLENVTTTVVSEEAWQGAPQLNSHHSVSRIGVRFEELDVPHRKLLRKLI